MAAKIVRPGAQEWVPQGATSVDELREAASACRGCELWEPATQVVFSSGSQQKARMALVGEQPGDAEDKAGLPFVGPAGKLLQRAVDEAGIDRDLLYVTNAVKHFRFTQAAPGKRRMHQTPDLAQLVACKPWLEAELQLVSPEVVVCLGATAAKSLLGKVFSVTKQRGEVLERETSIGLTKFVATVHPSSILRTRGDRDAELAALVDDLRVAHEALNAG